MAAEENSSIRTEVEVCKSSSFAWDPGALEWKRPSKVRPVIPVRFLGFALDAPVGFLLQRDTLFFTCGEKSASAAQKGTDGDAESVCAPLVDIVGEHAWLQDRSALHHSSSRRLLEPQRRPRNALFLRAFLDRSHVVPSGGYL